MANNIERATEGVTGGFYGRLDIFTSATEITEENVMTEVNNALFWHIKNLNEETDLLWYRRGVQPILERTKKRNKYVCNRIVENHAEEIVTFKNGYFLTQPAYYIARNEEAQDKVKQLNEYLYRSGKIQADNDLVNWFHTVGKACLLVEPGDDDETPFKAYSLDPRQAFVVYSVRAGNRPMMGINAVAINNVLRVDVYTDNAVYRMSGEYTPSTTTKAMYPTVPVVSRIESIENNVLGRVPMVEYRYNSENMAAFEPGLPLLNALNNILSNRVDALEQFVQSLIVIYNADLEEGEDSTTIKDAGMLLLKSTGDQKSDIKILSESLDQEQLQKLVDDVYERLLAICKMPITTKGDQSASTTGAAILARDGWYQADNDARNTEDEFKKSDRYAEDLFIDILAKKGILDIKRSDFELQFVRNETSNVISKSQALLNLLTAGMHPVLSLAKSGISNDPMKDYALSESWMKMKWGDPDKPEEPPVDGNEPQVRIDEVEDDTSI